MAGGGLQQMVVSTWYLAVALICALFLFVSLVFGIRHHGTSFRSITVIGCGLIGHGLGGFIAAEQGLGPLLCFIIAICTGCLVGRGTYRRLNRKPRI